MLVTLVCPDMKFVEVCGTSAKNLADFLSLLKATEYEGFGVDVAKQ